MKVNKIWDDMFKSNFSTSHMTKTLPHSNTNIATYNLIHPFHFNTYIISNNKVYNKFLFIMVRSRVFQQLHLNRFT